MTKTLSFFNRFSDTLELLSYWFFVAGAAASALAVLVAVVLSIVYVDRPDLGESAGSLLGKGVIGFVVFVILARQVRKQRAQSKQMDAKLDEMARKLEEANERASTQSDATRSSG